MVAIRLILVAFSLAFVAIGVIALPEVQEAITEPLPATIAVSEEKPSPLNNQQLDVSSIAQTSLNSTVAINVGQSIGSGFLINESTIITAYHVVVPDPSSTIIEEINITFEDGRTRTATIEVFDSPSDLAALSLSEPITGIPFLQFEAADNINLGDFVLAIGSPLGLDSSVSLGVISNIERNSEFQNPLQRNLLQTDASVNPGNSGGPLVNLSGKVVGIIQLRPEEQGGRAVQGVSFALRADAAVAGLAQLYEHGNIDYFRLGISGRPANSEDTVEEGVLIEQVFPDTPAEIGGIEIGDVILSLDEQPVSEVEDIITLLWAYRDGEVVSLEIATENGMETKNLTLEAVE